VVPITDGRWTRISLSDEAIKQLLLVTPNLPGDDGLNHPVRLRITAQYLNMEGRNRDDEDWTSIPVDAVVKGKPVTVALNRHYLLNALRFGLNEIEVEDPLSPVVFSKGGKKMIIMPVNLDGPKVTVPTPPAASSGATTGTTPTTPAAQQTTPQEQPGAKTKSKTLIILGCRMVLPPELERELTVIEFALPGKEELAAVLGGIMESANIKSMEAEIQEKVIDAASGLTTIEAENAFALSVVQSKAIDPVIVAKEKA
jgi:hypothetical protein